MRKLVLTTVLLVALGGAAGQTALAESAKEREATAFVKCPGIVKGVLFYRTATWKWQNKINIPPTKSSFNARKARSCKYAKWVANLWEARAVEFRKKYEAHIRYIKSLNSNPQNAICHVFGPYCSQALAVARCESNFYVGATNGQYLGLFQMGNYARSRYGHGYDALTQARAAYAYFRDSGYDWSPWECKP